MGGSSRTFCFGSISGIGLRKNLVPSTSRSITIFFHAIFTLVLHPRPHTYLEKCTDVFCFSFCSRILSVLLCALFFLFNDTMILKDTKPHNTTFASPQVQADEFMQGFDSQHWLQNQEPGLWMGSQPWASLNL